MQKNKRSLSPIITSILLILIVLISIFIVWNVVNSVISKGSSEIQINSYTNRFSVPPSSIKYRIGEQEARKIIISVKRESGEDEIKGMKIILEDKNGNSYSHEELTNIGQFEKKDIEVSYGNNLQGNVNKISIVPIFDNNGENYYGGIQDSVDSSEIYPHVTKSTGFGKDYSATNLINPPTWVVGTSGDQLGFSKKGEITENRIIEDNGPFGYTVPLWEAVNDALSDADGGWDGLPFDINPNNMYRYTVWIKKTGSNDGYTYLGASGNEITMLDGTIETNPYFFVGSLPNLDKWYLIIGYIHPHNDPSTTHLGGIYDPETGSKVLSLNGNWNGRTDFKFKSTATIQYHRSYLFYDSNINDRQYFYGPRVDLVDGTEPSIDELLGKA